MQSVIDMSRLERLGSLAIAAVKRGNTLTIVKGKR